MAMPKTTQTRYMDGSVQATQRTIQVTPSLHLFYFHFCYPHKTVSSNLTESLDIHSTVEPLNRGHFGTTAFVLSFEVVLFSEVVYYLPCIPPSMIDDIDYVSIMVEVYSQCSLSDVFIKCDLL